MPTLLLPEKYQRVPFLQNLGHFFGIEALTGQVPTVSELTSTLASLRRSKVLAWLCSLSGFVSKQSNKEPKAQAQLAMQLLPAELLNAYKKQVQSEVGKIGGPGGLFHLQQLWFMVQMTVMCCKEDAADIPDPEFKTKLATACLMANSILQRIDSTIRSDAPTDDKFDEWCVGVFLPLREVYADNDVLLRSHFLWFECTRSDRVLKKSQELGIDPDIEKVFESKYTIPFTEFFLLLVSLNVHFEAERFRQPHKPSLLDTGEYLGQLFDSEFLKTALPLISQTPDELAVRLMTTRQSWSSDISPLREYPLIQVFDNKLCCPDMNLLRKAISDRVRHLLDAAYPEQSFRTLFGSIFEEYLARIVDEFAPTSTVLANHSFVEPMFEGTQSEAGDCILKCEQTAVVMEWKSNRLSAHQKYGASAEDLVQGIKDFLAKSVERNGKETQKKGARQLSSVLKGMLAAKRVFAKNQKPTDLSACKYYYPVIVTAEEVVAMNCVTRIIQREFDEFLDRDGCDKTRIKPLMILSVREFEQLQAAARSTTVETVLERYAKYLDEHGPNPIGGFSEFLYRSGIEAPLMSQRNVDILETYTEQIRLRAEQFAAKKAEPVEFQPAEPVRSSPIVIPDGDPIEYLRRMESGFYVKSDQKG